ncbi:reverse transcriptase domain-containing protein [Tanacetum coccineum]|uniref:Reverse transcriptase domain-containing protein n=1 Tax=Tanacetum coccineum TaxID=301880 RepID=A0ABQ5F1A9_9ASTR
MSAMANATPIVTTVTKTTNKEKAPDAAPGVNIVDFCEEYYEDILPIIMDKPQRDKRKEVQTILNFGENNKRTRRERENSLNSRAENSPTRVYPERSRTRGRERLEDRNVLGQARWTREIHPTVEVIIPEGKVPESKNAPRALKNRMVILTLRGICDTPIKSQCSRIPLGVLLHSVKTKYRDRSRDEDQFRRVKRWREGESPSSRGSESNTSNRGHWKSRTKSSRKTRMPNNVKTYDGTRDLEDHLKIIQAVEHVERWAMPTWCHMFNSTLIGAARVWFDELPPESIDGYKGLKATFLAYFMQHKKYVKDPVEIHNIKERNGETIEDFIERFKVKTGPMKGAPECMRISGFMHGVNNPELTKRLNEQVPKTMEEMMIPKRHAFEQKSDVQGQSRVGRRSSRFTLLTRTPKEILSTEVRKFKPPPPMVTSIEKRSCNKFCDFHNDKRYSTDKCMQLKKQIEELVLARKLSHLIKEIKQGRDQTKNGKKETPTKDKSLAIYMIQPWQRITKQKLTQSLARVSEITFPPIASSDGMEGLLVIEVEISGHMIHRMYIDGGSYTEVLYEHCFNKLWPEI